MHDAIIKGDEVRHGKHILLDAVSKNLIDSLEDSPLAEEMLRRLNDGTTPISPLTARQVVQSYKSAGELVFAIHLLSDNSCIGSCRLGDINWQARHAQLFIGIVSEADFRLDIFSDVIQTVLQFVYWEANLNRIYVHCIEDNALMRQALEQTGFTNEGRKRQEVFRDGRYLDKIVFSILQREWTG